MKERDLVSKILKAARREFPTIFIYKSNDLGTVGLPDLIGCLNGSFFGLELKRPGNKATKLQDHVLSKIRAAGGAAGVADSVESAIAFIRRLNIGQGGC